MHERSNWTTGACEAEGARIHYTRTGGAGPPLILLHGLTGNGACWGPIACHLEGEFDVVMPDARGHGRSSAPPEGYRYEDHAGDVLSLICRLGLTAPALLGHSMGGMTAAMVAAHSGELISALILADPSFLSPQRQNEVHASDVVEQHRRLLSRTKDDLFAELRHRHPHRSEEILGLLTEARLQTRIRAFDVLTPPNPEYHSLMSTIRIPTLLLLGDASVVTIETARELQSVNPCVRVEQIHNAGHGLPFDQPERFATLVRSFLTSLPP